MKEYKNYTDAELADAFIFPNDLSAEEVNAADAAFSKHRKEAMEKMNPAQHLLSKIMQLKFVMEDYINSRNLETDYSFGYFLHAYMDTLNKTTAILSHEITIDTSVIDSCLNDENTPDEKFLVRLDIHSNSLIPAHIWWRVLEKQKEKEIVNDEKKLMKSESKYVKKLNLDLAV